MSLRRCRGRAETRRGARARESRSNATRPEMSDGRSGRFSHLARSSPPTSTAPVPCDPGTVVFRTNAPTTEPASERRSRSVANRFSGPRSCTSKVDCTAMLRSPPTWPAHSWNAKRSALIRKSSVAGAGFLTTRPSTWNSLCEVFTCRFSNDSPRSPLAMIPASRSIVRSEPSPCQDAFANRAATRPARSRRRGTR